MINIVGDFNKAPSYTALKDNLMKLGNVTFGEKYKPGIINLFTSVNTYNEQVKGIDKLSIVCAFNINCYDYSRVHNCVCQNNRINGLPIPYKYIIPYGVDIELFKPKERIGIVAIWRDGKCGKHIVELFRKDGLENFTFYLVGDKDRWDRFPIPQDCKTNVVKVGFLEHEELVEFYNDIDYLLIPTSTQEEEGGPYVLLEAMACNKPVISRDVGYAKEFGAMIYNDEIDLHQLLIRLSTEYRNRVLGSSWSICIEKFKSMFQEVAERNECSHQLI